MSGKPIPASRLPIRRLHLRGPAGPVRASLLGTWGRAAWEKLAERTLLLVDRVVHRALIRLYGQRAARAVYREIAEALAAGDLESVLAVSAAEVGTVACGLTVLWDDSHVLLTHVDGTTSFLDGTRGWLETALADLSSLDPPFDGQRLTVDLRTGAVASA